MGWFRCPTDGWAEMMERAPRPLTDAIALADLSYLIDRRDYFGEALPGRVVLERRWGLPRRKVLALMQRDPLACRERAAGVPQAGRGRAADQREDEDYHEVTGHGRAAAVPPLCRRCAAPVPPASEDDSGFASFDREKRAVGTDVAQTQTADSRQQTADIHGGAGGRAAEGTTSTSHPPASAPLPPKREVSPTTGGAVGMVSTSGDGQPRLALPSAAAITGRPSDAVGGGRAAASGNPALLLDGAPDGGAGKRRRGASARRSGPPTDAEMQAWGAIVQSWQQISGRLPNWSPEAGTGEHIIRQIRALGAERLVQRFREAEKVTFILQKAREPDGLKIDALLRAENGLVGPLDRAVADRSVRDAFKRPPDASAARVATMTLPEPSERSQVPRNTTGDALAAWEETAEARRRCVRTSPPYLDHGPRLSADPDEHRRRADAWRQGLWADWCGSTHPLERDRIRDRWMQAYRGAM